MKCIFFLNWDLDIRGGSFRFRSYDFLTVLDLEGCFWFKNFLTEIIQFEKVLMKDF